MPNAVHSWRWSLLRLPNNARARHSLTIPKHQSSVQTFSTISVFCMGGKRAGLAGMWPKEESDPEIFETSRTEGISWACFVSFLAEDHHGALSSTCKSSQQAKWD